MYYLSMIIIILSAIINFLLSKYFIGRKDKAEIEKIQEDIIRFSFNTSVSAFMICVNELNDLKCNKREILEPLVVLLSQKQLHIKQGLAG